MAKICFVFAVFILSICFLTVSAEAKARSGIAKRDYLDDPATSCLPFGYLTGVERLSYIGIQSFPVRCDGISAGPGWIVIQQRFNGSEDFFRTWNEYKNGFGSLSGNFFIGLEKLYLITNYEPFELYVELGKFNGDVVYAQYSEFVVDSEIKKYALRRVGNMTGNAGDWLRRQLNEQFSTYDQDNSKVGAPTKYHGGWWYTNITDTNLNGQYFEDEVRNDKAINWGYNLALKTTKMMIRPVNRFNNL